MGNVSVQEWIQQGIDAGFISAPYCEVHDGVPATAAEINVWEIDGEPPCIQSVRLLDEETSFRDLQGGRQNFGEWLPSDSGLGGA